MSSIGNTVYKISDVHRLSFGKIVEQDTCAGWQWYRINWVNLPPANINQRPNYDSNSGWFRCDTVEVFQIDTIMNLLESLK
jgi:hypothetical protein